MMICAYDEIYVEGAMIRMGDMLEYACLDCDYDPDAFWKMFLISEISHRFEIGDVSVIAGKSGPELAYMVLSSVDHRETFPKAQWREERSDVYWCGWVLAYYQWYIAKPFSVVCRNLSIRMLQKMYPAHHEADIHKTIDALQTMEKTKTKTSIRDFRLVRGMTQQELATRAHMSVSQLQRLEYGERKVDKLSLKSGLALAQALGIEAEDLL